MTIARILNAKGRDVITTQMDRTLAEVAEVLVAKKIAGRREQLEGKIQERYGISKDLARKEAEPIGTGFLPRRLLRNAALSVRLSGRAESFLTKLPFEGEK